MDSPETTISPTSAYRELTKWFKVEVDSRGLIPLPETVDTYLIQNNWPVVGYLQQQGIKFTGNPIFRPRPGTNLVDALQISDDREFIISETYSPTADRVSKGYKIGSEQLDLIVELFPAKGLDLFQQNLSDV